MDRAGFEASLERDGYRPVAITMRPDAVNPPHVHDFEARLLVVQGSLTVAREDEPARTYRAGETFEMRLGCRHSETAGPEGAAYVAGRRYPAQARPARPHPTQVQEETDGSSRV